LVSGVKKAYMTPPDDVEEYGPCCGEPLVAAVRAEQRYRQSWLRLGLFGGLLARHNSNVVDSVRKPDQQDEARGSNKLEVTWP
jgi:hypothetical protein